MARLLTHHFASMMVRFSRTSRALSARALLSVPQKFRKDDCIQSMFRSAFVRAFSTCRAMDDDDDIRDVGGSARRRSFFVSFNDIFTRLRFLFGRDDALDDKNLCIITLVRVLSGRWRCRWTNDPNDDMVVLDGCLSASVHRLRRW